MGAGELYSGTLSPSSPQCAEVIVYVKSLLLPFSYTRHSHEILGRDFVFWGRVVTPSVLHPKSFTKTRHEHHIYVLVHVMECIDEALQLK